MTRIIRRGRTGRFRQDQAFGRPFRLNKNSPQAKGLVGWWPTLGQGGDVLKDYSGYGQVGNFAAGAASPTWKTLPGVGRVLDYDGGDYVDVIGMPRLYLPFATSLWFQVSQLPSVAGDEYTLWRYAIPAHNTARWQMRIEDTAGADQNKLTQS